MASPRPAAAVCLYRTLLHWTRAHAHGPPFALAAEDVAAACGPHTPPAILEDASGVARLCRELFRADAALPRGSAAASEALDRAFVALKYLNDVTTPALERRRELREQHADRSGVLYSVGTTFRHKLYGYTGVVVGWDKTCAQPVEWQQAFASGLQHGASQPFYSVLPDVRDCLALFGGPRTSKYVAQENVEPLTPALVAAAEMQTYTPPRGLGLGGIGRRLRVSHPELRRFFVGFDRRQGRYVPRRELAFEFPDEHDDPALATTQAGDLEVL